MKKKFREYLLEFSSGDSIYSYTQNLYSSFGWVITNVRSVWFLIDSGIFFKLKRKGGEDHLLAMLYTLKKN